MQIKIEFKDRKYTVKYGTMTAAGSTVKEAVDNLVEAFRKQVLVFFVVEQPKQ